MNIYKYCFYGLFLTFCFFKSTSVYAQENEEETKKVQEMISELQESKDVFAINRLINNSSFLEPEYAYKILIGNLKLAKERKNDSEIAQTYMTLGNFWHLRGNKSKAYENYYESELLNKRINNLTSVGTLLMNRGMLTEDTKSRIQLYKDAVQILKETNDQMNQAKAYLNLGNAYSVPIFENDSLQKKLTKNDIDWSKKNAFQNYTSADSINQILKNRLISSGINIYKAEWYQFEKNYIKAREYFQKGIEDCKEAGFSKGEVNCIIELARIEKAENQISKALELLEKAEVISVNYTFNDYLEAIYEEYVDIYSQLGNYKKALDYYKKFKEQSIALNEQNSRDKIHLLNLEFNMAENEYKVEKYQAQSKLNRLLLIFSVLVTIAVIGISYLIIKNKKRRIDSIEKNKVISDLERSAVEIKLKNQILEDELLKEKVKYSQNHLMLFANQVNKIDTFLSTLKSEMKGSFPEKQDKINSLKISFSEVLNNQNELKQLNSLSSQLNQEFFFYLRQNYPTISKEDEQLLSYIILDMGGKEISHNLNISQESVYKKRYRLRKKLNIPNEDSFLNFYEKITQKLKQDSI